MVVGADNVRGDGVRWGRAGKRMYAGCVQWVCGVGEGVGGQAIICGGTKRLGEARGGPQK
jgi:hypothetical protein